MKHLTLLERADLVKMFNENMSSIIRTERPFRIKYPAKKCPTAETLREEI